MRALTTQLQILEASETNPVVRVPVGDTRIMKQALDAGAVNILVPMVESGDQARQLVRDVTYPPHGDRGVGYSVTRAGGFGTVEDYGTTADAQICLMVQVENRKGLAALDEILEIDGIDGVFIGPADLAADLGHMGDLMHPEVKSTIVDTTKRIAAAGKIAGFMSPNDEMTNAVLEAGARFVGVGSDLLILNNTARSLARKWVKSPL
jgi:4-hydroxy-2-oxoheptanedioate aldolase